MLNIYNYMKFLLPIKVDNCSLQNVYLIVVFNVTRTSLDQTRIMQNKFVSDRQFLLSIKPLTDLLRRFLGFTQMVCAKVKIISNGFSDYLTRTIVKLPLDNTHVLPVHNGGHYWWRRLTRCCGALPANNTEEDSRRNS